MGANDEKARARLPSAHEVASVKVSNRPIGKNAGFSTSIRRPLLACCAGLQSASGAASRRRNYRADQYRRMTLATARVAGRGRRAGTCPEGQVSVSPSGAMIHGRRHRRASMTRNVARLALVTAAGLACLLINDNWSTERPALIAQADARIGHPLTPLSVAGVHRRAARRDGYGYGYGHGYGPDYGHGYGPGYGNDYGYGHGYGYGYGYGHGLGYGVAAGVATAGAVAAGAAATGAYYGEPPAAAYPAGAPSFVHDAEVVPPGYSATVTDPQTGRTCTISPTGYHWCWRP
jgi:hypothetical protein